MPTYRFNLIQRGSGAKFKATVQGDPLGDCEVTANDPAHALGLIALKYYAGDRRPVTGKTGLKDGIVLDKIAAGTHVRLKKPYKVVEGGYATYDRGVVVQALDGNRFGVHLYRLGLTNAQDQYYGPPGNQTTVDFSATELVGVPKPANFLLPVKLAV